MKLIVTTFLVYKVKKCLLKSGKVSLLKSRKVKEAVYQNMFKPWGHDAQGLGNLAHPHVSIPNPNCQSSILFLVSIYILHILFLLSIDIQNPFYKIKRQKKVRMGIKEKGRKKEKGNNSYSKRRVCNKEYKGEI